MSLPGALVALGRLTHFTNDFLMGWRTDTLSLPSVGAGSRRLLFTMMIRTKLQLLALLSSLLVPAVPLASAAVHPGDLGITPATLGPDGTTPGEGDGPTIVVEIRGLRSNRGHVLGALFDSAEGWGVEGRQVAVCRSRIVGRRAFCPLTNMPSGSYGFAFLHDENDNEAMDTNILGLPEEGFGFSNDAPVSFGPPDFAAVRFRHAGEVTTLVVQARYGI
jgi:uncharacterized protein (DUF2141 family)